MALISPYHFERYTWTIPGQPTPAPRLTQSSAHNQRITHTYYVYRAAVVSKLLDAYPQETTFNTHMLTCGLPFVWQDEGYGPRALLEYWLWFITAKSGTCMHGDPDN